MIFSPRVTLITPFIDYLLTLVLVTIFVLNINHVVSETNRCLRSSNLGRECIAIFVDKDVATIVDYAYWYKYLSPTVTDDF